MMRQVLSPAFVNQIKTVVRRVLREMRNEVQQRPATHRTGYLQGYLDAAITAATDSKTEPATGTVTIWARDTTDDELKEQKGADGQPLQVDVVNRTDIAGESGAYCHIRYMGGEWQIVVLNCAAES